MMPSGVFVNMLSDLQKQFEELMEKNNFEDMFQLYKSIAITCEK